MKRKAMLLRLPEELFNTISRQSERFRRNEFLVGILSEHFKDEAVPIPCKATPDVPGMIECGKQGSDIGVSGEEKDGQCKSGVSDDHC